ncbi:MAG: hypothetical protein ACXU8A_09290 [Burkholderiaceae bacterium]
MKTKIIILSILIAPISAFAFYWFFRGLTSMETLSLRGSGGKFLLISASNHPYYFWPTLLCWGVIGTGLLLPIVLGIRKHFFDSSTHTDA